MADKAVIKIDVNSEEFQQFKAAFDKYAATLKETSSQWQSIRKLLSDGSMSASLDVFRKMAEYSSTIGHGLAMGWHAISRIAKISLGVATGGFLGMGVLSYGAYERYRTATGLGLSPGQLSAFGAYAGQYVDASGLLQNVANSRQDLTARNQFMRLGISARDLDQESNFDLAEQVMRRARMLWAHGPHNQQYAEATGLGHFFSLEELRRLEHTPDDEFERQMRMARGAVGGLNFPEQVARQWTDLAVQLRKAGVQIETVLINGLAHLTGPLGHLSDAIVKAITAFMSNPHLKEWIDMLARGIERLGSYLASDRVAADIAAFMDGIGAMAAAMKRVAGFFSGPEKPPETAAEMERRYSQGATPSTLYEMEARTMPKYPGDAALERERKAWVASGLPESLWAGGNYWRKEHARQQAVVEAAGAQFGLPHGMLTGVWGAESGFGANLGPSPAGALGPMQLMPANYRSANIDPNVLEQAAPEGAREIAAYYKQYGDWDAALAAYNMGPNKAFRGLTIGQMIKQYGADWESHLPDETRQYIQRVKPYVTGAPQPATQRPVHVSVSNSTASRVAIMGAQVAH